MQKLIAKYGLAAHLALLAVAPLFLFPFADGKTVMVVQFWLSFVAACWVILEPSVRRGEHLHNARARVASAVFRDPFFWALVVVVLVSGARALNTGIGLAYDAEGAKWQMAEAVLPILPGSVGRSGDLLFAAALSLLILLQGCRHSLGRQARQSFVLLASAFAGVAAIVLHFALYFGSPSALAFVSQASGSFSFVGLSFGVYFLAGAVSLVIVSENEWNSVLLLPVFAIAGNGAGLFSFASFCQIAAIGGAFVVLLVYGGVYSRGTVRVSGKFKQVIVGLAAVVCGIVLVVAVLPKAMFTARLAEFQNLAFFPEHYWEIRKIQSAVALKSWIGHLWAGAGIGAYPLCFRFGAQPSDWALLPVGATAMANGWWQLLAERGVVGAVLILVPAGFLLYMYAKGLWTGLRVWEVPHPACLIAPILIAILTASAFLDCSTFRIEVLMAAGPMLAISAAAFPRTKRADHG